MSAIWIGCRSGISRVFSYIAVRDLSDSRRWNAVARCWPHRRPSHRRRASRRRSAVSYWLLQRPVTALTEQQAVTRWMQALLPLFEEQLSWPPCAALEGFCRGDDETCNGKPKRKLRLTGVPAFARMSGRPQTVETTSQQFRVDDGDGCLVALPPLLTTHPSPDLSENVMI